MDDIPPLDSDDDLLNKQRLIKQQLIDRIAQITAKPKPTYEIDGQVFKWNEYLDILMKQLQRINELLAAEDGPYEIQTFLDP